MTGMSIDERKKETEPIPGWKWVLRECPGYCPSKRWFLEPETHE